MEQVQSFEDRMQRLEQISRTMERGDAGLEESMKLFEEGTALIRECSALLNAAEQKVTVIRNSLNNPPQEEPFASEQV